MEQQVTLTENAAKRIAEMRQKESKPQLMLRLRVDAGGCSGFSYVFDFDDQKQPDDMLFEHNGAGILVDPVSLELLKGATVDYVEELVGSYFQVKNPNAQSGCGCGVSFSV